MVAGAVLLALFGVLFVVCLVRLARRNYWRPVVMTALTAAAVGAMLLARL